MAFLHVVNDLLLALAAALAGLAAFGWTRQFLHSPPAATGDAELAELIDQLRSPATRQLAVAVVDVVEPRKTVRSAFVGCDSTTRFELGSVTKGLTGLLIADASDRGEIDLADPAARHLPALAGTAAGRATLAQLASHTSGLPRLPRWPFLLTGAGSLLFGLDPYRWQPPVRLLRAARRCRTSGVGRRRYSNLGVAMAGQAVASAAGLPYGALLDQRILSPLGMTDTATDPPMPAPRGWRKHGRRSCPWRMGAYAPAGGVVSTTADLAGLVQAILRGTVPGGAALGGVDEHPGLFWVNDGRRGTKPTLVWHNGETGGYAAFCAIYPQTGRGVLALANRADAADLERLVADVTSWLIARSAAGDRHL